MHLDTLGGKVFTEQTFTSSTEETSSTGLTKGKEQRQSRLVTFTSSYTYGSDIGGTLVTQLETLDVLTVSGNSTDGFVSGDQGE